MDSSSFLLLYIICFLPFWFPFQYISQQNVFRMFLIDMGRDSSIHSGRCQTSFVFYGEDTRKSLSITYSTRTTTCQQGRVCFQFSDCEIPLFPFSLLCVNVFNLMHPLPTFFLPLMTLDLLVLTFRRPRLSQK
jgi:hypothetical protein